MIRVLNEGRMLRIENYDDSDRSVVPSSDENVSDNETLN